MPRKKIELTEDQKQKINHLRDQGMNFIQISKETGIGQNKVQEYLKATGRNEEQKDKRIPDKKDQQSIHEMFRMGASNYTISSETGMTEERIRQLRKQYIQDGQPGCRPADQDLSTRKRPENEEIVRSIRFKYPDIQILTNMEAEIGGKRTVWRKAKDGELIYDREEQWPVEHHVFDVIIPKLKVIVVTTGVDQLKEIGWWDRLGDMIDPQIPELKWFGLLVAVAGWQMYYTNNTADILNIITWRKHEEELKEQYKALPVGSRPGDPDHISCISCQFKTECTHTYCKLLGEPERPPLDLERLQAGIYHDTSFGYLSDIKKEIDKVNTDEYKFWDQKGRIGKHNKGSLSDKEFQDITGMKSTQDVAAATAARLACYQTIMDL